MSHGLDALKNSHLEIFDKAFIAQLYHEQCFISVTTHEACPLLNWTHLQVNDI